MTFMRLDEIQCISRCDRVDFWLSDIGVGDVKTGASSYFKADL